MAYTLDGQFDSAAALNDLRGMHKAAHAHLHTLRVPGFYLDNLDYRHAAAMAAALSLVLDLARQVEDDQAVPAPASVRVRAGG